MANAMITFPDPDMNDSDEKFNPQDIGSSMHMMSRYMGKMARYFASMNSSMDDMKGDVASVKGDVKSLNERVIVIEQDEALKEYQADNIRDAVRMRVSELLGIKWIKEGGVSDECMSDYVRYYGKFCGCLHNDAKKARLEARRYQYTPRKNYKELIEFIHDWVPMRGVDGLKEYYDNLEKAKKEGVS